VEPEEIHVHVRAYREANGTVRIVAQRDTWPSTPLPTIGETTCILKLSAVETAK
jgi:hypothetical protein